MNVNAEWRTWDLIGLKVTQLRLDFQLHVPMWSLQREILIIFGTPFVLRRPTGEDQIFDPEQSETLCPLLSLLHRPVERFAASSDGRCLLRFADGTELHGEPHEKYEAWETHGEGDLGDASLLCGVGGGSPWG